MDTFAVGDIVDVKAHGRATILSLVTDPSHSKAGRCLVQYHEDDTTFYCNPKKLRLLFPSKKKIVVTYKTEDYQDAAVHNVEPRDICLEIGCHEGTTVHILNRRCTFAVGVDITQVVVERAQQRYPELPFHCIDGFNTAALKPLFPADKTNARNRSCSTAVSDGNGSDKDLATAPTADHVVESRPSKTRTDPEASVPNGRCRIGVPSEKDEVRSMENPGGSETQEPSLTLTHPPGFNKIFIDLSGKAPLQMVCRMIWAQIEAFPGAQLFVKNEALFRALLEKSEGSRSSPDVANSHTNPLGNEEPQAARDPSGIPPSPLNGEECGPSPLCKTPDRAGTSEVGEEDSTEGIGSVLVQLLGTNLLEECETFLLQHRKSKKGMDCIGRRAGRVEAVPAAWRRV